MKIKVPFFQQTNQLNCGLAALKMILAYFGEEKSIEELSTRIDLKKDQGISTIQIATIAASLGFKTDFYSKHLLFDEENLKLEFYKKYSDINFESSKYLLKEAKKAGVNVKEKTFLLDELLDFVKEDSVPIALVDWNAINHSKGQGYQGHFVPIVGYDEKNIYIHNSGLNDPKEFLQVDKDTFDRARKAIGTDEDIIIIHKR